MADPRIVYAVIGEAHASPPEVEALYANEQAANEHVAASEWAVSVMPMPVWPSFADVSDPKMGWKLSR